MLGDNPEKSKNPLKKAMRRRNAKTVTFTAPTFVEPADYGDYSDEEENGDAERVMNGMTNNGDSQEAVESVNSEEVEKDETAVVEPLKVNGASKGSASENADRAMSANDTTIEPSDDTSVKPRTSDEILLPPGLCHLFNCHSCTNSICLDGSRGKSRNGTPRNTDSFFKDDSVETRKITLTPNLLRDDSTSSLHSIDAKESTLGEKLEKSVPPSERPKDDRKRKEKKPGMLSGLFKSKKKDRKGKFVDEDDEKDLLDSSRVSSPSMQDVSPSERGTASGQQTPARQLSKGKLQKSPPSSAPSASRAKSPMDEAKSSSAPAGLEEKISSPPNTMRFVQSEPEQARLQESDVSADLQADSQTSDQHLDVGSPKEKGGKLSPITNLIRPSEPRPEKVKKAKQRVELDDFDSSPDEATAANPFDDSNENLAERKASEDSENGNETQRSQESSDDVSPFDSTDSRHTPPLTSENSSEEDHSPVSPTAPRSTVDAPQSASTSSSTPTITSPEQGSRLFAPSDLESARNRSPLQHPPSNTAARSSPSSRNTDTPPTPSSQHTSTPTSNGPTWSDAALHAYMNGDNDIRDLLLVVRDNTNVVPVSADHPLMKDLFVDERKSLRDMDRQLDGLLGQWMERKGMAGPGNGRRKINATATTKI